MIDEATYNARMAEIRKERRREANRKYREANRERCLELSKLWHDEHPEYAKEIQRRYRAKKKNK